MVAFQAKQLELALMGLPREAKKEEELSNIHFTIWYAHGNLVRFGLHSILLVCILHVVCKIGSQIFIAHFYFQLF